MCFFGDPIDEGKAKNVFVVGINPSSAEYEGRCPHLKKSPEKALKSQLGYFKKFFIERYKFFKEIERFFEDKEITTKLRIEDNNIWNKVGYLDLVKCVTKSNKTKQWNGLRSSVKKQIKKNCQNYLERQLRLYQPKLIIAYGRDVGEWFGVQDFYNESYNLISNPRRLGIECRVIYVPQRQGKHSRPEVNEIKVRIKEFLRNPY